MIPISSTDPTLTDQVTAFQQDSLAQTAGTGAPPATQTADKAHKHGGHHHGHHGGGHMKQVLDSVSTALGTDPSALQSSIADGTTLSTLATQKGVSQDTLLTAIKAGLGENGADGASLDEVAQTIANRVPGREPKSPYSGSDGSVNAWSSTVDVAI